MPEESLLTIEPREGEFLTIPFQDSKEPLTELDIARSMRDGNLPTPQHVENIQLFDMRITGTGTSFRDTLNEYVYRPPENFLTDEFVARCNGLPVIFEHPKKKSLDTEEFRNRSIGSIILPYIKGDEVWGIARIYDADAAELMQDSHKSTSPAVVFRKSDGNETVALSDGTHLLIEGIPSYLDHLAICKVGVWDKGNGPTGITQGDQKMPETDKEVIKKGYEETTSGKKDEGEASAPAWADALGKKFDSLSSRMDELDKVRKDSEEKHKEDEEARDKKADAEEKEDKDKKEDARRKDSEEKEEEKRKEDSRRNDSVMKENAQLKERLASLELGFKRMSVELSSSDKDDLAIAQSRADSLFNALREPMTAPLAGEDPISYRKRLVSRLQKYSPKFKETRMDDVAAGPTFDAVEGVIYSDAQSASVSSAAVQPGQLHAVKFTDMGGRVCTKYVGDIKTAFAPFIQRSIPVRINPDLKSRN